MSRKLTEKEKAANRRMRQNKTLLEYNSFAKEIQRYILVAMDRINDKNPRGGAKLLRETANYIESRRANMQPKIDKILGLR